MQTFTAETLKSLLIEHDDGVLKTGSHSPGRDFCAMEFIAKVAGEPWTDKPVCVNTALGAYCRRLNDGRWPDDATRTEVMLPLLAAVFGTRDLKIDVRRIASETIKLLIPVAIEAAASVQKDKTHADAMMVAAQRCREDGTRDAALNAKDVCRKAAAAYAYAAADAAAYAAAAYAAYAYAYAAAAADAAADAADAAAYAAAAADAKWSKRVEIYKISIGIVIAEINRARGE